MLEVVRTNVEISVLQAALDPFRIGLDTQSNPAVQRDGERLRPAHPTKARGQCDRAGEGAPGTLAPNGGERLVRPLGDALGPDVDPRARRHLTVHRQTERLQSPELVPRRPLR